MDCRGEAGEFCEAKERMQDEKWESSLVKDEFGKVLSLHAFVFAAREGERCEYAR